MTFRDKVDNSIAKALLEKPTVFLVDLIISSDFKISVYIDGDNGITLHDCIDVSRAVESNLDRDDQDYALEVASVGVGSPLKMIRQYKKNIGRTLIVKQIGETIEAELVEANDNFIILSWDARENKKLGKGKETVKKTLELPYSQIIEAKVTVNFN